MINDASDSGETTVRMHHPSFIGAVIVIFASSSIIFDITHRQLEPQLRCVDVNDDVDEFQLSTSIHQASHSTSIIVVDRRASHDDMVPAISFHIWMSLPQETEGVIGIGTETESKGDGKGATFEGTDGQ